jgi:hypothetical protein
LLELIEESVVMPPIVDPNIIVLELVEETVPMPPIVDSNVIMQELVEETIMMKKDWRSQQHDRSTGGAKSQLASAFGL